MGTASNRFVNFSGVEFTPQGGTAVPIPEVQDIRLDPGADILTASGDADVYETAATLSRMAPKITITTQAIAVVNTIAPGTHGTLSYTLEDFYNGVGTGALTYMITNCIVGSPDTNSQRRQPAQGTFNLQAFSVDGHTSPIAISIAA